MDRERSRLTPEDMFPPVVKRDAPYNGEIGPCKDKHYLCRYMEDGKEYIDVIHPTHCYVGDDAGLYHTKQAGIMEIGWGPTAQCAWQYNVLDWVESSRQPKEGLDWIGDLYGDGAENAYDTLEIALPLGSEVEVTWHCKWWYDSYTGEHDGEFYWWVEKL